MNILPSSRVELDELNPDGSAVSGQHPEDDVEVSLLTDNAAKEDDAEEDVPPGLLTRPAKAVLLLTAFVDILGFSMPNPLVPFYYTHVVAGPGHRGLYLGLIMASFSAGQFVGSLAAGVASDKMGRRTPILACLLGNSCCLVLSAFAPSIWWLIAARGMAGLFSGTPSVCSAFVCDLTPREDRVREMSHLQSAISIGSLTGPAIGVVIGWSMGVPRIAAAWITVCLCAALVAAGAFIAGLFFLKDLPRHIKPSTSNNASVASVLPSRSTWTVVKGLLAMRDMRLVLAAQLLTQLVGTIREISLPALLVTAEHDPIWQVLIVFATLAIASPIVLGVGYPRVSARFGNKAAMAGGLFTQAVGLFLIPLAAMWFLVAPLTLLVACGSFVDPALQVVTSFLVARSYGTALGLVRSIGAAARIGGPVLGGSLFDAPIGGCVGASSRAIAGGNATFSNGQTAPSSVLCVLQQEHVLPFWVSAGICCVTAFICTSMKKTDAPKKLSTAVVAAVEDKVPPDAGEPF